MLRTKSSHKQTSSSSQPRQHLLGIHAFIGVPDRSLLLSELTLEAFIFFSKGQVKESSSQSLCVSVWRGGHGGDGPGGGGVRLAASAGVAGADRVGGVCGANNRADREGHALGGPVRALPHRPHHAPSPFSSRLLFFLFSLLQALALCRALSPRGPRLQFFSARLRRQLCG